MGLPEILIIVATGVVAGFLNTVAGGGSLITMPLLIFLGLPGTVANGTNRVAILSQNLFAVGGFHSKGQKLPFPYTLYLAAVSLVGGFIGAWLAVDVPDRLFNRILAVIMIMVVGSILAEKRWKKAEGKEVNLSPGRQVVGVTLFFLLGIYGGFIQAGIGFMVIALLTHINHLDLVRINYIKVFAALLYTGVAVLVFALENKIIWTTGLLLAVGQGFGGWYASRWSVDKGEKWIRRVLVVTVVALAVKLWFF